MKRNRLVQTWLSLSALLSMVLTTAAPAHAHSTPREGPGSARSISSTTYQLGWNTFLGGTGYDTSNAVAADGAGNVYVAGFSGPAGDRQIMVAKLDSTGALLWMTYLGGTGNDAGYGIALDGSGNVYVSGYSDATWGSPRQTHSGSQDGFAAKLDTSGTLVWNTFFGGSGADIGHGIAVDGSGNVYVAGESTATWGSPRQGFTSSESDAFAVKLDSSGARTWNTFLGGSAADYGYDIGTVGSGNVYVLGDSFGTWGSPVRAHLGGDDPFVAKLDSSGYLTWNTFMGGGGEESGTAMVVAGSGIYITGYVSSAWGCTPPTDCTVRDYSAALDAFVAEVDPAGALAWNTFLGGNNNDFGNDIQLDGSGNLYLAGTSYDTWGSPVRGFSGTPGTTNDGFAAKLDSTGGLSWNTFLGGSANDSGTGIASAGGNVYVAGGSLEGWTCSPTACTTQPFTTEKDGYAAKVTSAGALTWNSFVGGYGEDEGRAIAVDSHRNIYVAGYSDDSWGTPVRPHSGGIDAYVAKLNSSGTLQWHTFLGGNAYDDCWDIAVDDSGNVYVTGGSDASWGSPVRGHSGDSDSYAAKLNSSGVLLWNTFLGGSGIDWSAGIAEDGSGNVYVAGQSSVGWGSPLAGPFGSTDAFLAKLLPSGGLNWMTFMGGSGGDYTRGLAVDKMWSEPYVVGYSTAEWGTPKRAYSWGKDAFVASFDSSGGLYWNTFLGGSGDEMGRDVALFTPYIFVGGTSGAAPSRDVFAAKLASDGSLNWSTTLGGTGDDYGGTIAVDSGGYSYVTGSSTISWGATDPGGTDAFVAGVRPDGLVDWNMFVGGAQTDIGEGIAVDHAGAIYLTGYSLSDWGSPVRPFSVNTGIFTGIDAFVAKVSTPIISGNAGVAGATLSYTVGTNRTATADEAGDYAFSVPTGWSGTVTPSKMGYFFAPTYGTYANVTTDQPSQHYTAIPRVKSDFDADGKSDMGYFHPATGVWSILESSENFSYATAHYFSWGQTGDIVVPGDYDGDGMLDPAVRRPPGGGQSAAYRILLSTTSYNFDSSLTIPAGWPGLGDTPVPGDYNGDGRTDPAIWRNNTGVWIIPMSPAFNTYQFFSWGVTGDTPVGADVDGDGMTDIGYWRPSTGVWGFLQSTYGYSYTFPLFFSWGTTGDVAVMADYDGDHKADPAVVIPASGGQSKAYRILLSTQGYIPANSVTVPAGWPGLGDTPVPQDYDGDGKADAGIWRNNTGVWIIPKSSTYNAQYMFASWGATGDQVVK